MYRVDSCRSITNNKNRQRKELSHQQLIMETLGQLAGQFKPEVNMIKKRVESLIEREYLERMEGAEISSYRYLA